jgi:hypothetical protein
VPDATRTTPASDEVEADDLGRYLPALISARVAAALRARGTGVTAYLPWTGP